MTHRRQDMVDTHTVGIEVVPRLTIPTAEPTTSTQKTSSPSLWVRGSTLGVVAVAFVRRKMLFLHGTVVSLQFSANGTDYSNARRPRSDQPEDPYTPFLYLLPLLLMFLLASFASSVQSSANKVQFSLHRNDEFAHHHKTRINGIDYYVSSEFDTSIFIDESTTGTDG
jgi:hypothetical protein